MRHFQIELDDGRSIIVRALSYQKDDEQYVFDTGEPEVTFFKAQRVVGIHQVNVREARIPKVYR
jgi:hypothetical protein